MADVIDEPLFRIEKGIPLKETRGRDAGSGRVQTFLKSLEVGDSFAVPKADFSERWRYRLFKTARVLGITLTSRTMSETEVRIWRVEGEARSVEAGAGPSPA